MFRNRAFAFLVAFFLLTGCASTERVAPTPTTSTSARQAIEASLQPESVTNDWYRLDATENRFDGTSTEKAYRTLLADKKPQKKVVVAVIDSGVDTEHEDLDDVIWTNEDEIPDNGIDDDKNGYVDDIHGWNFIGGPDGKHVGYDTYEVTREYARLSPKYGDVDPATLSGEAREEYEYFQKVKEAYEARAEETQQYYTNTAIAYAALAKADSLLKDFLGIDTYSVEQVESINSPSEDIQKARTISLYFSQLGVDAESLRRQATNLEGGLRYGLNLGYNPRTIIGDNYEDLNERIYGNNDVRGLEPYHGTHVAGIIAAERNNGVGTDGIANHVEIMVIRAVPNGDERDKDIANAIRYAVDNDAHIINMSFGKDFSPHKEVVDAAVKYADEQGVLLIHASGNDGENIDEIPSFPTRQFRDTSTEAQNWIEVGASSWEGKRALAAGFSNYGQQNVDLFAPGVHIYSPIPGNKYDVAQGTSMAAPVVSGIAALVMSYYPELTAAQVRDLLLRSATPYKGRRVLRPGGENAVVDFATLSRTGGIVNAYNAIKLADEMSQ